MLLHQRRGFKLERLLYSSHRSFTTKRQSQPEKEQKIPEID